MTNLLSIVSGYWYISIVPLVGIYQKYLYPSRSTYRTLLPRIVTGIVIVLFTGSIAFPVENGKKSQTKQVESEKKSEIKSVDSRKKTLAKPADSEKKSEVKPTESRKKPLAKQVESEKKSETKPIEPEKKVESGKKPEIKKENLRPRRQSLMPTPVQAPMPTIPTEAAPAVISISTDGVASVTRSPSVKPTPVASTPAKANITNITSATSASDDSLIQAIRQGMDGQSAQPNKAASPSALFIQNEGESIIRQIGKVFISLAFVITIALGSAWAAKKYLIKKPLFGGGYITYLSSYPLSQKSKLHLVKVGEETFLIGEGINQLTLISKIESPETLTKENRNLLEKEDQELSDTPTDNSFKSKLANWHKSLDNQSIQEEVKNSLLVLGALSKRLSKKGNENAK